MNAGKVGAIEDEADVGVGRVRHVGIADPKEDRRPAPRGMFEVTPEARYVCLLETVVDDADVEIASVQPADRPDFPAERARKSRTDARIDRLFVRMSVGIEIDDPQYDAPDRRCAGTGA
ncbi:MAG: hypothetical protein EOR60_22955 [Mesorhizobium sp.]|nr:MAG: hypothetical protein EOR60_22955 [Mesorhizobium sp.]